MTSDLKDPPPIDANAKIAASKLVALVLASPEEGRLALEIVCACAIAWVGSPSLYVASPPEINIAGDDRGRVIAALAEIRHLIDMRGGNDEKA